MSGRTYSAPEWEPHERPVAYQHAAHECTVDQKRKVAGRLQPTCGGVFECGDCGQLVGWCKGADDEEPDLCDVCWHNVHGGDDDE
jgi:hypothetical protein